jgi:hypothetical protein
VVKIHADPGTNVEMDNINCQLTFSGQLANAQ